ncbi:uncharacterized protein LOC110630863 [Manihot esculenta]|uniref:DUF1639 domain-containing protein n=1 Tax=Manihot esculenta TaxID=3983 RepID=A0A2C9ULQ7_MANES|nr:uncharacterized protein LOC110630863 [Manihot esculenta]OAY31343.1 hypothetical protein MANES_14G104600v8 [Manihot esculenta]
MVYSGETGDRVRGLVMAMGTERSKPPLHNFNLPCLKWGNQKHLRCMKVSDSAASKDKNISNGISTDRQRSSRSPPSKFFASADYEIRSFKRPKTRNDGGGGEGGISEVREKLMFDFKTAADKMKDAILKKGVPDEENDMLEVPGSEKVEDEDEKEQSPSLVPPTEVVADREQEVRPWNLRTRRAACKAPIARNSVTGKGLKIEERNASNFSPLRIEGAKSPRLRGEKKDKEDEKEKETEQVRTKFALALSRKEIEEDFMKMVGHRPARRPKKRHRNVQKQMDMLFPGLWLTEVTVDTYKVPEIPDNGKR